MNERLPGRRVVVTRPRERSEELCFLLEDEGAEVIAVPLLEFLPPSDPRPFEAAVSRLSLYRWIALASPAAVSSLVETARLAGTLEILKAASIAVVGNGTERAVRQAGLPVSKVAEMQTGVGLYEILKGELQPGDEVLLPSAEDGRTELADALRDAGFMVSRVAAYRSAKASVEAEVRAELFAGPVDAVVFASPRTFEAFGETFGEEGGRLLQSAKLVAIGPTTTAAIELAGGKVSAVAEKPTAAELVEAVVRAVERSA